MGPHNGALSEGVGSEGAGNVVAPALLAGLMEMTCPFTLCYSLLTCAKHCHTCKFNKAVRDIR